VKNAQLPGLSGRRVAQLLSDIKNDRSAASRIDAFSSHLLGQPYKSNPLIGSASTPEVFTASLDGFDCVTYIETVLALALASKADFTEWLRKIRYQKGRIQWDRRNHYMTAWIRNNIHEGILKPIPTPNVPTLTKQRVLNVVPGLAAQRTRIKYVPKRSMPHLERSLQTGDLIFFVSTRKNLDVFHAGIIVRNDQRLLMRHASRTQGHVVEQELTKFLSSNRMSGIILARPCLLSLQGRG
jgi:hypothetical protein